MGKDIEMLEDHSYLSSKLGQLRFILSVRYKIQSRMESFPTSSFENYFALFRRSNEVDATQESALTGSTRSDDANDLAFGNLQIYLTEDYMISKSLANILELKESRIHWALLSSLSYLLLWNREPMK